MTTLLKPFRPSLSQMVGTLRSRKEGKRSDRPSGLKSVKPKMPCCPGFAPVMKLDQLTAEISGNVTRIGTMLPSARSPRMTGMTPSSANRRSSVQGTPSRPMTQARFAFFLNSLMALYRYPRSSSRDLIFFSSSAE
jgi:hypothetical protein